MRHSKHRRTSRPSRNHPKDLPFGRGTRNAERVSFVPLVPSVSAHAKSNDARLSALPRRLEGSTTHVPLHAADHPSSIMASPSTRFKAISRALIGLLKMESTHHFPHFSSLFNMHTARAIGADFVVRIPVCLRQEQLPSPTFLWIHCLSRGLEFFLT